MRKKQESIKKSFAKKNNSKKTPMKKSLKKALLLISGGIDSPVAGKLLQEKGFELKAIHFSQKPFTDDSPEKKCLKLCKMLGLKELIVVEAGEALKEISNKTHAEYYFVLMKRLMMRVSERIAKEKRMNFLATGESLGQVSSQTLSNLNTINQSTKMEILRPLLFKNKQEIIDLSKKFRYYEESIGKEACDILASSRPKTITNTKEVEEEEKKCNIETLVEKTKKTITLKRTN